MRGIVLALCAIVSKMVGSCRCSCASWPHKGNFITVQIYYSIKYVPK